MKLILTGASGFIALELIPLLRARGIEPVLISARRDNLQSTYPDLVCTDYDNIETHLAGAAAVLHLAAKNNNTEGTLDEFRTANVKLTLMLLEAAKAAGVPHFIYASSLHTLALDKKTSNYARSKAEAEAMLESQTEISVSILHMAAVYGKHFAGKLSLLNHLPGFLKKPTLSILSALRPTLHISIVAECIACILDGNCEPPYFLSNKMQENSVYKYIKRFVDLIFAVCVILFAGWFMVILWVVVRLDSPGPGLFAQERVGYEGKIFTCYKFRTMKLGTKQAGSHELSSASITRIGRFLRKTKLDELPQIINIIRNEMSLIGPRPCLPVQGELIEARRDLGVLSISPGISGFAQIQNIDMSNPKLLARVDAIYMAMQCLPLDFKIAIATFTGSGMGDKVKPS